MYIVTKVTYDKLNCVTWRNLRITNIWLSSVHIFSSRQRNIEWIYFVQLFGNFIHIKEPTRYSLRTFQQNFDTLKNWDHGYFPLQYSNWKTLWQDPVYLVPWRHEKMKHFVPGHSLITFSPFSKNAIFSSAPWYSANSTILWTVSFGFMTFYVLLVFGSS